VKTSTRFVIVALALSGIAVLVSRLLGAMSSTDAATIWDARLHLLDIVASALPPLVVFAVWGWPRRAAERDEARWNAADALAARTAQVWGDEATVHELDPDAPIRVPWAWDRGRSRSRKELFPGGDAPDGGHVGELYEAVYARLPVLPCSVSDSACCKAYWASAGS
jgi:hypothetical protein